MSGQLGLFGDIQEPKRGLVGPAEATPALVALGQRLPQGLYMGTSSWSFPGWHGLVYDRQTSQEHLARHGLKAYARHPLLRCVGVDRSYYAPLGVEAFQRYADAVPAGFRFLVKAHEWLVVPELGDRSGPGQANPHFLDPGYALREVVDPFVDGLGARAGPLLFQFPPLDVRLVGGVRGFHDRLHAFLTALPRRPAGEGGGPGSPLYAVELRHERLLTPDYAALLADTGAVHCFNSHPSMPPVAEQAAMLTGSWGGLPPALVVRWMLAPNLRYAAARERYAPFDRVVDADPATREAIAELSWRGLAAGRPVFVVVNNKAEGCSPESIRLLAEQVAAREPAP